MYTENSYHNETSWALTSCASPTMTGKTLYNRSTLKQLINCSGLRMLFKVAFFTPN